MVLMCIRTILKSKNDWYNIANTLNALKVSYIIIYTLKGDNMFVFEAIGDFFGNITDWMNDNLDANGPAAALVAVLLCTIIGITLA